MSSLKKMKSLIVLCCLVFCFFSNEAKAQRVTQIQNGVLINQQGQVLSNNGFGRIGINQVANPTINVNVPNSGRNGTTQIQNGVLISQQSQVMTNNFSNVGNVYIGGNSFGYQNFTNISYFYFLRRPVTSHFDSSRYFCRYQSAHQAYDDGYHYGQGYSYDAADDCIDYIIDYCEDDLYPQPDPLICTNGQYKAYYRGQWVCTSDLVCNSNETRVFLNGRWTCQLTQNCECPALAPCPTGTVEDTTRRDFERLACYNGTSARCQVRRCIPSTNPRVCTADVQRCADGSFVSRDPNNNCQFRACPVTPVPTPTPVEGQACTSTQRCLNGTAIPGIWTRTSGSTTLTCTPVLGFCRESRPPLPTPRNPQLLTVTPVQPTLAIASNINLNRVQTQNQNQNLNQVAVRPWWSNFFNQGANTASQPTTTNTNTNTNTPTSTSNPTVTSNPTNTNTFNPTVNVTVNPVFTPTNTNNPTNTLTSTPTLTNTPTTTQGSPTATTGASTSTSSPTTTQGSPSSTATTTSSNSTPVAVNTP